MAIQEGQFDLAKILVENGADYKQETAEGYTCLHLAALRYFFNKHINHFLELLQIFSLIIFLVF